VCTSQAFVGVARLGDDLALGAEFGHRLADQQRDEGATKTDHQRKPSQRKQVQTLRGQELIQAQQSRHDQQHDHHGHVGQNQQHYTFHRG